MNKKVLFFTDIHGSLWAMNQIKKVVEQQKPTLVVFLGDLLYHGPRNPFPQDYNPMGVAQSINSLGVKSVLVKGNCDSEVDEMVLERKFVSKYTLSDCGKKIICTHGHKLDKINTQGAFAVIYGHFHKNEHTQSEGVNFVNISSVSLPKPQNAPAYGVFENGTLSVVDFDGNLIFDLK